MLNYSRKSSTEESVPIWLLQPGPILVKKHVRNSKFEPLVEEAELLESNPHYSHVRLEDGRETTISNRHLAPYPSLEEDIFEDAIDSTNQSHNEQLGEQERETAGLPSQEENQPSLRHSSQERRPPVYLTDYITNSQRGGECSTSFLMYT